MAEDLSSAPPGTHKEAEWKCRCCGKFIARGNERAFENHIYCLCCLEKMITINPAPF